MTKFEDHLLDDLMAEHGPGLARVPPPAVATRRRMPRRPVLAAVGGALAVAAAVAGTLVANGRSPAYAVTKEPNGAVKLTVYKKSGIAGINAKIRQLQENLVMVVPVEPGCPAINALRAPRFPDKERVIGVAVSKRGIDGSVTANVQGVPSGDIVVLALQTTGNLTFADSAVTSPPIPRCVSLSTPATTPSAK